ncbi:MAG: uracil-DNA glycosylase family protein [Coprobacillaceae bacterium]
MDDYLKLKKELIQCRDCEEKFGFEPHPIMWGNENAKIMQISQAPSLLVHNTGKPFNDLSGKKLRNQWYEISDALFYNKDNFYIASMAHCYPGKSKSGGDNPPPKHCSKKWLPKELEIVNNEIYIVIGSYAAKMLFPRQQFTTLIFNNQELNGKPAFVLPHPSPLNQRWFKQNPEFEKTRIKEIRKIVHRILNIT